MIELLKSMELHDVPVKSISFDFYNEALKLVIQNHDTMKDELFEITLQFSNVRELSIGKMDDIKNCEITDCKLGDKEEGTYVLFSLLCGQPFYPVDLRFIFREVQIIVQDGHAPNLI